MKQLKKGKLFALLASAFTLGSVGLNEAMHPMRGLLFALIALFFALFVPKPTHANGASVAGIDTEVWTNHIEENLYKDNEFILEAVDDSQYINYRTVHVPQAGANPNVVLNRVKGGARTNPSLRTDLPLDYNIDEFTTDPFEITNAEEVQLSYNKRESVLYQHETYIKEKVADRILTMWAPTGTATLPDGVTVNGNIFRTSGILNNDPQSAAQSTAANVNGTAIGTRLVLGLFDVRRMKVYFDNNNIPQADRHMLLSANMMDQLISDLIATKFRDSSAIFDQKTGKLDMILGFKVHMRSTALTYNNAATPVVKAYGSANAADDNDTVLFWHKMFVRRASGGVKVYETLNSATDYGDIYSVLLRHGGAKGRLSELGVAALVQAVGN